MTQLQRSLTKAIQVLTNADRQERGLAGQAHTGISEHSATRMKEEGHQENNQNPSKTGAADTAGWYGEHIL